MTGTHTRARPILRVVDAGASPEEVAAIMAAVTAALAPGAVPVDDAPEPASGWITASRLAARGASASRGDWRRSGRIGGRVPT